MKHLLSALLLLTTSIAAQANTWDHLFDKAQYSDVKISPDGKHLAVKVLSDDKPALAFVERATMKVIGGAKLPGRNEVGQYYWVNNDRVVIQINQSRPWLEAPQFYGELYAVNKDSSRGKLIYGYRAGEMQAGSRIKKKEAIRGWAGIIDLLPSDDKHILISSEPMLKNKQGFKSVLKLNVETGVIVKKITQAPVYDANFITNSNGELTIVTGIDKKYYRQAYLYKNAEWHQIPESEFGSSFTPLSIDKTGKFLYTLDNYQQDKTGLFKLNLEDGSYKEVLTDKKVDIADVERTSDLRNIYALKVEEEFPAYYMLNKSLPEAQAFKNLIATFPGHKIDITSVTKDSKTYIVETSSDIEAGNFYLYDSEKQSLGFLFKYFPQIDSKQLAYTDPVKIPTSDSIELNGLFTQGKVKNKGDIAPLVVYVHGGPHAKDSWGYDTEVQYLALNGYSVLQVNFRGSSGFGEKFQKAGWGNWGTLIQQDIYEAYQWAITSGKAEAGNACIMGASFGGYSALQNTINYPDSYKCAISHAGVYDLEGLLDEGNVQNLGYGKSYLRATLGKNPEKRKAMSPLFNVNKIQVPLFIAHGENDKQAPYEQAEDLVEALEDADKDFEWYSFDGEQHGLFEPENKKEYMSKVLKFLNEHMM